MNQDTDREMDFLLRREGRRNASAAPRAKDAGRATASSGAPPIAEHLDADEMTAYAEGALSERARMRYAAHLADCDRCRNIVTGLVLTTAPVAEAVVSPAVPQAQPVPARSWRERLSYLFSPPVLRYAAPALALIAFAAIMLVVVTRNRNGELSVARNEQPQQQQAPIPNEAAANRGETTTGGAATASPPGPTQPLAANANSNSTETRGGAAAQPSPELQERQQETAAPAPLQMDGVSPKDSTKSANDPRNETPAAQARAAEGAQKAQPPQTSSTTDKLTDRPRESDATTIAAKRSREETAASGAGGGAVSMSPGSASSNRDALGAQSEAAGKRKNEAARSAPSTPAGRLRRGMTGADESGTGAATRTVAGKTFRQQNGVWVDTAYNSQRSTTRVRRGSEQYRALVADEPIIGSVANALSGPCIVVAGNRAYYIY